MSAPPDALPYSSLLGEPLASKAIVASRVPKMPPVPIDS
jgi:hypothetical protein